MNKIQQQAAELDLWVGGDAVISRTFKQNEINVEFSDKPHRRASDCHYAYHGAIEATKSIILNMMGK